jgi:hypothetical protein
MCVRQVKGDLDVFVGVLFAVQLNAMFMSNMFQVPTDPATNLKFGNNQGNRRHRC